MLRAFPLLNSSNHSVVCVLKYPREDHEQKATVRHAPDANRLSGRIDLTRQRWATADESGARFGVQSLNHL